MTFKILDRSDLDPTLVYQVTQLFKQLGGDKKQVPLEEVLDESNGITLACCLFSNEVIGIASMCHYKVVSGRKGWIEDVVVHKNFRGKGIGKKLMQTLLAQAKEMNLSEILLFTEDHRKPAIRLYTELGFQVKDSRIYTLKFTTQ